MVILCNKIRDWGLVFTNSIMGNSTIECLSKHISKRLSAFGLDLHIAEIPILLSSRLDLE
jgi:hypothetical protein